MQEPANALERAAERANEDRLEDPNILCVGYGLKFRGGEPTWEVALQYYVHEKLPDDAAIDRAGSTPVPDDVDGFKTDVIEILPSHAYQCPRDSGLPTGARGTRQENPLVGGTSSSVTGGFVSFPTGYGTLGGICFNAPGGIGGPRGAAMVISNAHVWGSTIGATVIQPTIPLDEYVEAVVKLLVCGPVGAYVVSATPPSPLTAVLSAGATVAFVAAIASDAEDPSRWGQRVGAVPAPGTLTKAERIAIRTEIPDLPFAGRPYVAGTDWDYHRETTAGDTSETISERRHNEHVLYGKRVWTERPEYGTGERVSICAEVATERVRDPDDYFVVAHCVPTSDPDRVVRRVLRPGTCERIKGVVEPLCFRGFSKPAKPKAGAWFPIHEGRFVVDAEGPAQFASWEAPDTGDRLVILRLPFEGVRLSCPPCSQLEIEAFEGAGRMDVTAFNSAGVAVDHTTIEAGEELTRVMLTAHEIVYAEISGASGESFLVGACAYLDPPEEDFEHDKEREIVRLGYTGMFDLPPDLPASEWGIMLSVQTVDRSSADDPIVAAGNLGGITASANMASPVACAVVVLLDTVFNVI